MNNQELATTLINAIKEFANKPNNLDNFEGYLSAHFDKWFEKYANTPENLVYEMENFANMEI